MTAVTIAAVAMVAAAAVFSAAAVAVASATAVTTLATEIIAVSIATANGAMLKKVYFPKKYALASAARTSLMYAKQKVKTFLSPSQKVLKEKMDSDTVVIKSFCTRKISTDLSLL